MWLPSSRSLSTILISVVISASCVAGVARGVETSVDQNSQPIPVEHGLETRWPNGEVTSSGSSLEEAEGAKEIRAAIGRAFDEAGRTPDGEDGSQTTEQDLRNLISENVAFPVTDRTGEESRGHSSAPPGVPSRKASTWKLVGAVAAALGVILAASYWRNRRQKGQGRPDGVGKTADELMGEAQTDYSLQYRGVPYVPASLPPELPSSLQYDSLTLSDFSQQPHGFGGSAGENSGLNTPQNIDLGDREDEPQPLRHVADEAAQGR